jgi:E3 ubiquitin-protein ligase makorin
MTPALLATTAACCAAQVLGKAEMSARRFGLMACDHAFCLGCIRNWRSTAEVDKTTVSAYG